MPRTNCPRATDLVERRGRRFGVPAKSAARPGRTPWNGRLEWAESSARLGKFVRVIPPSGLDLPETHATESAEPSIPRLRYTPLAPEPNRMMVAIKAYLEKCGLGDALLDLVWLRTSLLNGCGYGIQMHSLAAMAHGERANRLIHLRVGEESPGFTERERCAIAWTDAVTLIHRFRVPDELYSRVRTQFTEKEVVDLTWAVVAMNSWNRMAIAFRIPPGVARPASVASR